MNFNLLNANVWRHFKAYENRLNNINPESLWISQYVFMFTSDKVESLWLWYISALDTVCIQSNTYRRYDLLPSSSGYKMDATCSSKTLVTTYRRYDMLPPSSGYKMDATCSFKTLVTTYRRYDMLPPSSGYKMDATCSSKTLVTAYMTEVAERRSSALNIQRPWNYSVWPSEYSD
jgi:hypothetical protein